MDSFPRSRHSDIFPPSDFPPGLSASSRRPEWRHIHSPPWPSGILGRRTRTWTARSCSTMTRCRCRTRQPRFVCSNSVQLPVTPITYTAGSSLRPSLRCQAISPCPTPGETIPRHTLFRWAIKWTMAVVVSKSQALRHFPWHHPWILVSDIFENSSTGSRLNRRQCGLTRYASIRKMMRKNRPRSCWWRLSSRLPVKSSYG